MIDTGGFNIQRFFAVAHMILK